MDEAKAKKLKYDIELGPQSLIIYPLDVIKWKIIGVLYIGHLVRIPTILPFKINTYQLKL